MKFAVLAASLCLIIITSASAQTHFGIGAFYGSSKALGMDVIVSNKKYTAFYKLGAALEMDNGARGKSVDERLPNYGGTEDGNGSYLQIP
jgi:hypothetical protein